MGTKYHKIQTIFKRCKETHKILPGDWTKPEFELLKDVEWTFTEKVDGTNIRVIIKNGGVTFAGRTEKAQIPKPLVTRLEELFYTENMNEILYQQFPYAWNVGDEAATVILFGEGYGGKIQSPAGMKYRPDATMDFILFDVRIDDFWLERESLEEIATNLKIDIVPIVGSGSLQDAVNMVKGGFESPLGKIQSEGLVLRPRVELRGKYGRIITKIKHRDFKDV